MPNSKRPNKLLEPEKEKETLARGVDNPKNPKLKVLPSGKCHLVCYGEENDFGTADNDLIMSCIDQLGQIIGRGKDLGDSERVMLTLNSAIASIVEMKPKDSIELMLATQMATTHNVAMELFRRSMLSEQTFEGRDLNLNYANKLLRAFTAQVEALNKYRTKGQQKITVQHVQVNDGGQAIVGNVKGGG